MKYNAYTDARLTPEEVQALRGITVLEFGTDWCSLCQEAQPHIDDAIAVHQLRSPVRHLRIEDAGGRPLGRHFRIKLWPTVILLKNGTEVARIVRPSGSLEILKKLDSLSPPMRF